MVPHSAALGRDFQKETPQVTTGACLSDAEQSCCESKWVLQDQHEYWLQAFQKI